MKKIIWIALSLLFVIGIEFTVLIIIVNDKGSSLQDKTSEINFNKTDDQTNSQQIDEVKTDMRKVYIPVETILQLPELPNGCEITSVTSFLHFYNYDVAKTEMADNYLPKQPFHRHNNKLYGANPYEAYAGNPRDSGSFLLMHPRLLRQQIDILQILEE